MSYTDFIDIKDLASFGLKKNASGEVVKLTYIKVIKIEKDSFGDIEKFHKTSYFVDYKQIALQRNFNRFCSQQELKPLYNNKIKISERKKNDIQSLLNANLIPSF